MKIIVSTDSDVYATIVKNYGIEVPFIRPQNISDDLSLDYDFIKHTFDWLFENENYTPDIIVQLRPTSPFRKTSVIDEAIQIFSKNINEFDSLRSVIPINICPFKMYTKNNNELIPLFKKIGNLNEPFNCPRQILPQTYIHNGYIDILNPNILDKGTISGDKIYSFVMEEVDNIDIDTYNDWEQAELIKL
jgi:N-acylneuraminate cytidylyltransferase